MWLRKRPGSVSLSETGEEKSAKDIAELARNCDESALKTWEIFGENLAHAMAWGINVLDPGIVVVGGSIADAMDLFSPAMEKFLRKHICPVPAEKTKIVKAKLGGHAGFIGAACLVLQKIQ